MSELRQTHLPYCLSKQADGRYVVVNRRYKPLGFTTKEWVKYEEHPVGWALKGLTAKRIAALSWSGSESADMIYLYNDGCIPTDSAAHMAAYCKRLALLMKLQAE